MLNAEFHEHYNFTQALKRRRKMLIVAGYEYIDPSWDADALGYNHIHGKKT